jgi:2'-5' RNA ligase
LGFDPGRDAMVLHLTLGRIKNISDKRYFQQIIQTTSNSFVLNQYVDRFYLFESILRTKGPEYHVLETFFFKKN